MDTFRWLQPAPLARGDKPHEPPEPSVAQKQTRQRHADADWEQIREYLVELLYVYDLKDAAKIIKDTRGLRSYRSRIARWGLQQNYRANDLGVVVAKVEERKLNDDKDTVVIMKGERLEVNRLELFQRRAKDKQSPSGPTPQSVEYYTPYGPGLTPDSHITPPAWSPLNIQPEFRQTLPHSREQQDFCAHMIFYDQSPEPVVTVEVDSQRLESSEKDSDVPQHDLHQAGVLAVVGRGRFSKREKASQLLWQATNMARSMQSTLQSPKPVQESGLSLSHPAGAGKIQFFSKARPAEFGEIGLQHLLGFIKHNRLLQSILGLTRQDLASWVGPWAPMDPSEVTLVETIANHLFGDTTLSYPSMDVLNIVVKFNTTSPKVKPVLLRVSVGQDPRHEVRDCHHCCQDFQVFDYIGPEGAVKLHLSSLDPNMEQPFRHGTEFSDHNLTRRQIVYTRWSQLAYMYQGWASARVLKRCLCQTKPVHYIDLFNEKTCEKEEFDAMVSSHQASSFEPFPQERGRLVIIGCKRKRSPSEDRWNPQGDEGSENEEEFEPFPPDDHSTLYLSQAIVRR